jgi:putative tricarboxylic transport membrane protein
MLGLCLCVFIAQQMWVLDVPFAYEPLGPKAFPLLLAILMSVCCVVLFLRPSRDVHWPDRKLRYRGLLLFIALLGYGVSFEWLGFPLATCLMTVVTAMLFDGRIPTAILTGVTLGVGGYLFFDRLLQLTLPLGRIWG